VKRNSKAIIMRTTSSPARAGLFVALLAFLHTAPAIAGGVLGANGEPVTTSEYSLDLFQGPIFAGSRVTSLAGAYVAIAEDVDGDLQNPAAPAVRPFFSYTHFDYWLGFGLTFPADLASMDFFNSGQKTNVPNPPNSFVFFTPALNLQWGEFGVGLNFAIQQYALADPEEGRRRGVTATIPTTHLQFAHGFYHNQLVFGLGLRYVTMTVNGPDNKGFLFRSQGGGAELGMVWKPENRPIRLGIAYRTPIVTRAIYSDKLLPNENGDLIIPREDDMGLYLPTSVSSPWDLNFGFALQLVGRPMNPRWRPNDDVVKRARLEDEIRALDRNTARVKALAAAKTEIERQAIEDKFEQDEAAAERDLEYILQTQKTLMEKELTAMNKFYLQLAASMVITGSVEDAVGVESLVSQTVNRSGQKTVVSPRLGLEASVFPHFLKVRAGSYLEPTRFETGTARIHGTAGVDIKLAVWNVFGLWPDDYMWRLALGGDAARDYITWGLTIAGWYPRHSDPDDVPDYAAGLKPPSPNLEPPLPNAVQ
jgi:hypothetical protein